MRALTQPEMTALLAARRGGSIAGLFSSGVEANEPVPPTRASRRKALFHETPVQAVIRTLATSWAALRRDGLRGCLAALDMILRDHSIDAAGLPDPAQALSVPDGLAGLATDLSVARLAEAYARGLYPSCHVGPMKLWAPSSRAVARPCDLVLPEAAQQQAESSSYSVTFDQDFDAIMRACADAAGGNWLARISPKMMWAFAHLHDAGYAHSFEVRDASGALVGGGYGVAAGRVFVLESLFARADHADAIGLVALTPFLERRGYNLIDGKALTPMLAGLGFQTISRDTYAARLRGAEITPCPGTWRDVAEAKRAA